MELPGEVWVAHEGAPASGTRQLTELSDRPGMFVCACALMENADAITVERLIVAKRNLRQTIQTRRDCFSGFEISFFIHFP